MTDWYDPYDEANFDPDNPWLADFTEPSSLGVDFIGDLSTSGRPQATDQATVNRQWTTFNNFLRARSNPYFNQFVAETTGAPVFDYGGFVPGGGITGTNAGFGADENTVDGISYDALAGGAGGGGGGFGGGSKYDPYFDASRFEGALSSDDQMIRSIAEDVRDGKDPTQIKLALRKTVGMESPDDLKLYESTVDDLYKVASGAARNAAIGGATGFATEQAGPLAKYWARSGMPSPTEAYGPDNLPYDIQQSIRPADDAVSAALPSIIRQALGEYRGTKELYDKTNRALGETAGIDWIKTFRGMRNPDGPYQLASTSEPAEGSFEASHPNAFRAQLGQRRGGGAQVRDGGGSRGGGWEKAHPNRMNYDRPAPTYESRKREYNYARGQATAQALRDSLFRHAQQKAKEAQYYQRKQRGWDNDVRQLAAMRIAPGRTPARDAMQAQLNVLRSMGLMG